MELTFGRKLTPGFFMTLLLIFVRIKSSQINMLKSIPYQIEREHDQIQFLLLDTCWTKSSRSLSRFRILFQITVLHLLRTLLSGIFFLIRSSRHIQKVGITT